MNRLYASVKTNILVDRNLRDHKKKEMSGVVLVVLVGTVRGAFYGRRNVTNGKAISQRFRERRYHQHQRNHVRPMVCEEDEIYVMRPDWLSWDCQQKDYELSKELVNAINPRYIGAKEHHRSYNEFRPWKGFARTRDHLLIDFLGLVIPYRLYCNEAYNFQVESHAIRTRQCNLYKLLYKVQEARSAPIFFQATYPIVSEEYFEYADIIASVSDYEARARTRPYVFVEGGAGYGHFSFSAHRILMQKMSESKKVYKARYLMIDVLDSLAPAIQNLANLNGNPDYDFHVGFLAPSTYTSSNQALTPDLLERAQSNIRIYGEDWGTGPARNASKGKIPISMQALFSLYKLPTIIDLVDLDIQRAEYAVLDDDTVDFLTTRVKRVHIGTHLANTQELTPPIINRFISRGWSLIWNFDHGHRVSTPYGPVKFGDGVLSFVNNRLKYA